jgi:hypothetical protein
MIIIKYIGVGLFIISLLLLFIYYYINALKQLKKRTSKSQGLRHSDYLRYPQKQTSKRQGLYRFDYLIIATVPENKWT